MTLDHRCIPKPYGECWRDTFISVICDNENDTSKPCMSLHVKNGDDDDDDDKPVSEARIVMERMTLNLEQGMIKGYLQDFQGKYCVLVDVASALFYQHHNIIVHRRPQASECASAIQR